MCNIFITYIYGSVVKMVCSRNCHKTKYELPLTYRFPVRSDIVVEDFPTPHGFEINDVIGEQSSF